MPTKKAICLRTGKPHRWRLDPNIKHEDISETGQIINFHCICANCGKKHVLQHRPDR